MTGALVLPGDPTTPNAGGGQALCGCEYCGGCGRAGAEGFAVCLLATQTVTQPVGTQLQVNILNGDGVCEPVCDGLGGNGIANAVASPDCASGCDVKVEQSYTSTERYQLRRWNSGAERDACGGRPEWAAARHLSESDLSVGGRRRCRAGDRRDLDAEFGGRVCGRGIDRSRVPMGC